MTGARRTTTATKWNANAARPIAVAFLPAKIGSGRTCKHAITVISLLSLPIRLRHALAENTSLAGSAIAQNKAIWGDARFRPRALAHWTPGASPRNLRTNLSTSAGVSFASYSYSYPLLPSGGG